MRSLDKDNILPTITVQQAENGDTIAKSYL